MRAALVHCLDMPEPDADYGLGLEAFIAAGIDAEWKAWDDAEVCWAEFDAAVIRATWDYPDRLAEFRAWIAAAAEQTRLFNPPPVMLGNLHKRYLVEMAEQSVPVVPTRLISRPEEASDAAQELGGERWVVKPAVGAGSMGVQIWNGMSGLDFSGDHLIQPYLESVERGGERALVWIDGDFTHKVVKQRRLAEDDESVSTAEPLTADERAFGEAVIEAAPADLLYARVDVMEGPGGEIWLSELELVEPSLFLVQNPPAADRLAQGVLRRLKMGAE